MNQSQDEYIINHRENTKDKRQSIFSRRSRVCQHATSSLCQPTLGGSAAKRCFINLVHMIGHRKNLPTSEVTQWHKQFTRVTFWPSTGEGTTPLTITGDGHKQSPTRADPPPLLQPSRWWQLPRETSKIRSATRIPSASRCNHSSNALRFSHNLTMMMDQWWRWVGGLWLSSQGCYVNENVQELSLEPTMGL